MMSTTLLVMGWIYIRTVGLRKCKKNSRGKSFFTLQILLVRLMMIKTDVLHAVFSTPIIHFSLHAHAFKERHCVNEAGQLT